MDSATEDPLNNKLVSLEELQDAIECIICLDVPKTELVFQCTNGHILCNNCHKRVDHKLQNLIKHFFKNRLRMYGLKKIFPI